MIFTLNLINDEVFIRELFYEDDANTKIKNSFLIIISTRG